MFINYVLFIIIISCYYILEKQEKIERNILYFIIKEDIFRIHIFLRIVKSTN
jgi:hypothetical protein